MPTNDLVKDIEMVRDEIKDLVHSLEVKYPTVIFSGSIINASTRTRDGEVVSHLNVVINTTHSD